MAEQPDWKVRAFQRPKNPQDWPLTPQCESGHLVSSNSGWRTLWPQILDHCNSCGLCFVYCPDGAIAKGEGDFPYVLADWCKGCGLCAKECPKDAIRMIEENQK